MDLRHIALALTFSIPATACDFSVPDDSRHGTTGDDDADPAFEVNPIAPDHPDSNSKEDPVDDPADGDTGDDTDESGESGDDPADDDGDADGESEGDTGTDPDDPADDDGDDPTDDGDESGGDTMDPVAECGNGVLEPGELCDGGSFADIIPGALEFDCDPMKPVPADDRWDYREQVDIGRVCGTDCLSVHRVCDIECNLDAVTFEHDGEHDGLITFRDDDDMAVLRACDVARVIERSHVVFGDNNGEWESSLDRIDFTGLRELEVGNASLRFKTPGHATSIDAPDLRYIQARGVYFEMTNLEDLGGLHGVAELDVNAVGATANPFLCAAEVVDWATALGVTNVQTIQNANCEK